MIDEKRLIEKLGKEISGMEVKTPYMRGKLAGLSKAIKLAEKVPEACKWIPCESRLPKAMQKCLTVDKEGHMHIFTFGGMYFLDEFAFCIDEMHDRYDVLVAWMRLSENPFPLQDSFGEILGGIEEKEEEA